MPQTKIAIKQLIDFWMFVSNLQQHRQRFAIGGPNLIVAMACAYQIVKFVISMLIVQPVKMNRLTNANKTNARRIMAAVSIYVPIRQLVFIVIVIKGTFTCALVIAMRPRRRSRRVILPSTFASIVAYVCKINYLCVSAAMNWLTALPALTLTNARLQVFVRKRVLTSWDRIRFVFLSTHSVYIVGI